MTAAPSASGGEPPLPLDLWLQTLLGVHGNRWMRTARNLVGGDAHLAEDAVFEALGAMARAIDGGEVIHDPATWMEAAVRRQAQKRVRTEASQSRRVRAAAFLGTEAAPTGQEENDPAAGSKRLERVRRSLAELPPRQEEVMRLRLLERKSSAEIAETLACSEVAVRMAQAKAVKSLRHLV